VKLYTYFGIVGIASILAWLGAIGVFIVFARSRRRHVFYASALGLAVAAYVLARVNSLNVSAIQMDQSEDLAAAQQAQQRLREQISEDGRITSPVKFAEDAPGEDSDAAGKRKEASVPIAGRTNAALATLDAGEPAYRQQGKQKRETGKKQAVVKEGEAGSPKEEAAARTLKAPDLILANRLDRYNLIVVRLLLLISVILIGWDYVQRFNTTFDAHAPLPLSGHWIDLHFPKTHAVHIANPDLHPLKPYMETVVRKGETFLYFGSQDPWAVEALPRLQVAGRGGWFLPKLVFGPPGTPAGSNFLFDAVWFGRYLRCSPGPVARDAAAGGSARVPAGSGTARARQCASPLTWFGTCPLCLPGRRWRS